MDSTTHTRRPNAAATASPKRATGRSMRPVTRGPNDARARLRTSVLAAALTVLVAGCASADGSGGDRAVGGGAGCDPNYAGACLDPNSSDYDCDGGSGNGPDYTGTVRVVGDDPHGLDRDGDGVACEAMTRRSANLSAGVSDRARRERPTRRWPLTEEHRCAS